MTVPPTLVATYSSGYSQASTALTVTFDSAVGDVFVVRGATEDGTLTLATPTGGTGLTWNLEQFWTGSTDAGVWIWTATASAINTAATLTVTRSGTCWGGFGMSRYSGSAGIGASNKAQSGTGTPSVAVTCSANSTLDCVVGDWNAVDGATRTWLTINGITPTSGNGLESGYDRNASLGSSYRARWDDVGTAGSKTAGLSAPSGMKWSAIAVEVLGGAGSTNWTQTPTDDTGLLDIAAVPIIPGYDRMSWAVSTVRG